MKKSRIICASLVVPLAVLLLPVLMTITIVINTDLLISDDAPVRAAGMLLFALIPILYIVLALAMALVAVVLSSMQRLTLRNLFFVASFVSSSVGLSLGLPSPFGLKDQLVGVFIFSVLSILYLSLGVVVWWRLAGIGHDETELLDSPNTPDKLDLSYSRKEARTNESKNDIFPRTQRAS